MYKLLTAVALAIGVCHGGSLVLQFTQLPNVQENFDYTAGGTYNGYALATINGFPAQSLICDDYVDETLVPSGALQFNYSFLAGSNPLEYVRFNGHQATMNYQAAAILLNQLAAVTNPSADTITDYQYALWNLFNPSAPANATQRSLQTSAQAILLAGGTQTALDYESLVIYTPTDTFASNQEFLGLNTPVGTPEPAVWPVITLAIAAVIWIRRRRSPEPSPTAKQS
jgi:hypothetical protein